MKTQRKLHHRGYLLPYASRATATPVARPRHVRNLPKVYPPLTIRPLIPVTLGRKPNCWGGETVVPTPALIAPTMKTRAHSLRATRFTREPIAPWTLLATAVSHPLRRAPRGFSRCTPSFHSGHPRAYRRCSGEKSLPTSGIQGQVNRGHPSTVNLVSLRTREVREGQALALREERR